MARVAYLGALGILLNILIVSCATPITDNVTKSSPKSVSTDETKVKIPTKEDYINLFQCVSESSKITTELKNKVQELIANLKSLTGKELDNFRSANQDIYNSLYPSCVEKLNPQAAANAKNAINQSNIGNDFFKPYFPPAKVGMKFTYKSTSVLTRASDHKSQESTSEVSTEIIEITGNKFKIKVINGDKVQEQTVTIDSYVASVPVNTNPALKLTTKYEGNETVTVPAGEFKDAAKVTTTIEPTSLNDKGKSVSTAWYVKGIGTVKTDSKIIDSMGNESHSLVEMKEYKIPA